MNITYSLIMTTLEQTTPRTKTIWRSPVVAWGALGAASAVLVVVVMVQWIADGVGSVDPGPDAFGGWKLVLLRLSEWGQFAAFVAIMWFVVGRRLVRRESLGFDAYFVLGALLLNFWDVMDNYWTFAFQYNAHHLNVESWGGYIPGWHSDGAREWAVPIGFVFGAYTWAFYLAVVMGCRVLDWARRTRPAWPRWAGFLLVFLTSAVLCAVSENLYLRIEAFANIRTPSQLTVWNSEPHGWPLYNPVLFGLTWTALTWLRWSVNGDGLSAVERGATRLAFLPERMRATVRFLAVFAFLEVAYLGLYFLPFNLLAAQADSPPALPSYFPAP